MVVREGWGLLDWIEMVFVRSRGKNVFLTTLIILSLAPYVVGMYRNVGFIFFIKNVVDWLPILCLLLRLFVRKPSVPISMVHRNVNIFVGERERVSVEEDLRLLLWLQAPSALTNGLRHQTSGVLISLLPFDRLEVHHLYPWHLTLISVLGVVVGLGGYFIHR